jgi:polyisoprenoid-binding protein YceI
MRDSHLKNEDYFDAQKYPRIRIVSTKVAASNKSGTWFLFGKLTIKDKVQEISFPFTATPSGSGYLFSGEFKINRKDFRIGGSSTISENVTVSLTVSAVK